MFRSVFTKYILAFGVLILVSFSMLSVLISATMSSYAREQHEEDVGVAVRETASLTVFSMREMTERDGLRFDTMTLEERETLSMLYRSLAENRRFLLLFLTDTSGNLIVASNTALLQKNTLSGNLLSAVKPEEFTLFSGNLGGFLTEHSTVAAKPILRIDGTTAGYAFAALSDNASAVLLNSVHKSIFMSSLWVMLAALVAAYFISDYMSTPLRNMITASKKYAKGNFDERVPVIGHSEISELSESFNNMAESLADLERMRNTFLCDTAHDLRTPMTTISGFIDGITSGAIPPEKQDYYLGVIQTEIHRLSALVTQILDMSRYEAGKRTFTPSVFDICETARLVLISFEQKIEEKSLDVSFEAESDYLSVYADKGAIYQVVYNLCDNAIKFSRPGGVFKIEIGKKSADHAYVTIYNEGVGIPPEDAPFIFSRFYKSDKSRGEDKNGFGVGLFIVKSIIDGHREKITLDSKEGEYCSFSFTLPLSKDADGRKHPSDEDELTYY